MAAVSGAGPGAAAAAPPAGPPRVPARFPEEELPPLDPAEVRSRLEYSERQFRNRRKLLIRGLPGDVTNQDVHELLKGYELKYCFVDKHKGTAFVTLHSACGAARAVQELQGRELRGHALRLQLQPPDAVLCVANLPRLLAPPRFQELLRPFGHLERCFLVHSPASGHSKGYGFVEFMKKDSAARAKSDLLGKQLGSRTLYVHWVEPAQLSPELLHSRCLLVEKLPPGYADEEGLRRLFGAVAEPTFCQLAVGQDGQLKGFAVLEFESPEVAERVQEATDGLGLAGSHLRVSFCAPGPPGRSMLAALIAAHGMAQNRGKGLLPEPNLLQLLQSLGNAASLPLLLQPLLPAAKQGILGAAPPLPLVPGPAALLQLALHGHAQKKGILGDSPLSSLALPPPGGPVGGELAQGHPKSPILPFLEQGKAPGAPRERRQGESAVSLLGEPPKDLKMPLNPYLNLQSLLPPGAARKGFKVKSGILGTPRVPPTPPEPQLEFPQDLGSRIFPQPQNLGSFGHGRNKVSSPPGFQKGNLGPPMAPFLGGSPSSCFSSGLQAGLQQSHLAQTPQGAQKRGFSHLLPSPEPSPEGSYVGQHSQGLGGHYADSYLKRKRIF